MPPLSDFPQRIKTERLTLSVLKPSTEDDGNAPSETLAKRNGYKLARRLPLASYAKCVGECDSLIYKKTK